MRGLRMIFWVFGLSALVTVLLSQASADNASEDYPESPLTASYSSSAGSSTNDSQIAKKGEAVGIDQISHHDLGGGGFNADVWAHYHATANKNVVYVGQWGFGASQPEKCDPEPRRGVKLIDVTDPANPVLIAKLNNPPLTTAEDVEVVTYTTGSFTGRDIAVVGIQACFRRTATPRGIQLWDVSNPAAPFLVGFFSTGTASKTPASGPTRGVHELTVGIRPDGTVLALLTVPFSDSRDGGNRGDLRIVDITNPENPVERGHFGLVGIFPPDVAEQMQFSGQGCFPFRFGHGITVNPAVTRAYLAYWDWGTKVLDIVNPASPVLLNTTSFPENADGDAHSGALTENGAFWLQADEDIPPPGNCKAPAQHREAGWGFLRIFELAQPSVPQVGSFRTPNSVSPSRNRKGDYSIHNPFVVGNKAYLSWYTDGIRVVDITSPFGPTELARFVPPAAKDPQHVLPFAAEVWGVVVKWGYIFASDMNSGLWVLRETNP